MFSLRIKAMNVKRLAPIKRPLASQAGPLTDLKIDNDGTAILTMQRMPVNSLNLDLLQELSKSLDMIIKNKARAMILTSASPTVFSAGIDIMEIYKPDMKRAETYWTTLQDVWIKLFGSPFITAAAINVGLIDTTASNKEDAIAKCKAFTMRFEKISPIARSPTKQKIRETPLRKLRENRQRDVQEFLQYVQNPMMQQGLEIYIEEMQKKAAGDK